MHYKSTTIFLDHLTLLIHILQFHESVSLFRDSPLEIHTKIEGLIIGGRVGEGVEEGRVRREGGKEGRGELKR